MYWARDGDFIGFGYFLYTKHFGIIESEHKLGFELGLGKIFGRKKKERNLIGEKSKEKKMV